MSWDDTSIEENICGRVKSDTSEQVGGQVGRWQVGEWQVVEADEKWENT